jgi:hypothetical protein
MMMGRALLVIGWVATLALVAAAGLGYAMPAPELSEARTHIFASLIATLLLVFAHCWIFLYLIGTGRLIRKVVADHGLEASLVEATRQLHRALFPPLLIALGLTIATFVLGSGALAGGVPAWVHHGLFYAALAVQVRALWVEGRVLGDNARRIADLDARLAAQVRAAGAP